MHWCTSNCVSIKEGCELLDLCCIIFTSNFLFSSLPTAHFCFRKQPLHTRHPFSSPSCPSLHLASLLLKQGLEDFGEPNNLVSKWHYRDMMINCIKSLLGGKEISYCYQLLWWWTHIDKHINKITHIRSIHVVFLGFEVFSVLFHAWWKGRRVIFTAASL